MEKVKTYQELVNAVRNEFVKGLEKDGLKWFKDWKPKYHSENGKSKTQYRGINHLRLSFDGFADTRYYTFKQIEDMKMKLKKSQHGQQVTKFIPHYDYKNHKSLTEEEYLALSEEQQKTVIPTHKFFYVFNAEQIEDMQLQEQAQSKVDTRLIDKIAKAMNVEVVYGSQHSTPCYVPREDKVYMPSKALFNSDKGLYATALHELAHASGHYSRLNRESFSFFGTEKYAFEELVAEMSSALLCSYLGIENKVDDNHKAYVKSWIKKCKDEPKALIEAFKLAENVLDYVIECAEIQENEATETVKETPTAVEVKESIIKSAKAKAKYQDKKAKKTTRKKVNVNAKDNLTLKTIAFQKANAQDQIINMIRFEAVNTLGEVKRYIEMPLDTYINRSKAIENGLKKQWGVE